MTSNNPHPDQLRHSHDLQRELKALETLRTIEGAA